MYWDTCILLAVIKNEQLPPHEQAGIDEVIDAVDRRERSIITSVVSRAEMFRADFTADERRRYATFFQRTNCEELPVTGPISDLIAEMRRDAKAEKLQISFADWIHVATAVVHRVHQFHTFDGKKSRPDARKKLIPLSGKPIVRGLKICTPQADQILIDGTRRGVS